MGSKKTLGGIGIPPTGFYSITAGAMASTNTITSPIATFVGNLDNVAAQVQWTGTPTGTISVLCSVDGVTYYALTFSPALGQPAGSAGGYLINLNQLPFPWVKFQYVNSSGSGTLNVIIYGKDLN